MKNGIDLSSAHGAVEWRSVKTDFVMLRASMGIPEPSGVNMRSDDRFADNMDGTIKQQLPTGAYHELAAITPQDARKEAAFFLDMIAPYRFHYPVAVKFIDDRQGDLSNDRMVEICLAFLQAIEHAGYYAVLYSHASWLEYRLTDPRLQAFDKWMVHTDTKTPLFTGVYGMWEYSARGKLGGIPSNVCLNIAYRDYPAVILNAGLNHLADAEPPARKTKCEAFFGRTISAEQLIQMLRENGISQIQIPMKPASNARKNILIEDAAMKIAAGKHEDAGIPEQKQGLVCAENEDGLAEDQILADENVAGILDEGLQKAPPLSFGEIYRVPTDMQEI